MTVTREAVAAAKAVHRQSHSVGRSTERLARLPEIVDELRPPMPPPNAIGCCSTTPSRRSAAPACWACGFRREYGGPGGRVRDVLTAVIQIARGSSNVAQALRAHFGFSERLLSNRATPKPNARSGFRVSTPVWSSATRSPTRRAGPVERGHHGAARHRRRTAAQRLQVLFDGHAVRRCGRGVGNGRRRSRRAGDHSRGAGRGRIVRRLGRIRSAHHRQRRNAIHRGRGHAPRGHDGVRRQPPRPRTAFLQLYLAAVAVGIASGVPTTLSIRAHEGPPGLALAGRHRRADPFVLAGRR